MLSFLGMTDLNIGIDSQNSIFTQYPNRLIMTILHQCFTAPV